MDPEPATRQITPASVAAVESVGIKKLKIYHMANTKRIKHNDLTHYFLRDHKDLPPAYLASCEKFFDSICWPKYYGGTNTKGKIYKLPADDK